ncbi:hypothetical protein ES703_06346 [subsurface metagenome]
MSRREFLQQSSKYVAAGAALASAPDLMAAQSKKQERPHFHSSAPTTGLQPESPLSANSSKISAS